MSKLFGIISLLLVILLCLNKGMKKYHPKLAVLLKKYHVFLVVILLVVSLIHGILAGNNVGMISGKLSWMILLFTLFALPLVKNYKIKMQIHHIFCILFVFVCITHILFLW